MVPKKPLNSLGAVYSEEWRTNVEGDEPQTPLRNYGRNHSNVDGLSVHFDNIVPTIQEIAACSDVAVGAVAWLTNEELLDSLKRLKRVAVVVQKEDFLRQDTEETPKRFRSRLRSQYDDLNPISYDDFCESYPGQQEGIPGLHHNIAPHILGYKGLHVEGAVRTIGYRRESGDMRTPVMHHKFMVFGNYRSDHLMFPNCVVTGSFNWTRNATSSRENILVIYDEAICADFVSEWAQLWARSERLDWECPVPQVQQHYIGT